MKEYQDLGHMEEINFNNISAPYFFLPHHCIVKPHSSTTKIRVVFDGSAKTSTNKSLNNILAAGPTVQDDVFSILLRFRMPRFAFTADIEKMYRQVKIDEADRKYQLIWWRSDPNQKVKCFQLTTVTYGTTSAPYLATKCLQKLADQQKDYYPLGSEVLKRDFYVDDVLSGSNNLQEAIGMQTQLRQLLHTAGFKLRKWCANHPRLFEGISLEDREISLNFESKSEEHIKTIGLTWLPKTDDFCIKTSWEEPRRITKRTACSDIARIFDPLGIMAPVIVTAKMFLQRLWSLKLDWDAALPQDLHTYWLNYRDGLKSLNNIKFPRHVFAHRTAVKTQFHIFADASEKAYGAVAYVRSTDKNKLVTVRLLCAKSRVAPIKLTTLPRLELCAAKLAAELAQRIKTDLNLNNELIYLWSDSQVVLAWINSSSSSFQPFVANRVSRIQEITIPAQWRYVNTKDNPADILSRGLAPDRLESSILWFYGPTFLHGSETIWPAPYLNSHTDCKDERKRTALPAIQESPLNLMETINHQNSFRKMQRIIAYMLRFANHTRKRCDVSTNISLNASELNQALIIITRWLQQQSFEQDIKHLRRHGEVPKNSSLSSLCPFVDDKGILRVGGRLEASHLSYDAKHPILLPYGQLTKFLLNDIHKENHHVGPQTLLAIARQNFWPVKGKTLARSVIQHCTQCTRANPKMFSQLMGNLPAERVQPARPFINSGVDFCGPIWTHFKMRGKRPQKSYIAVFCCFATKATHLEVVSDLTTNGFIGALKRFTGRRGHCRNIYCDNATNFVGAKNQLEGVKEMLQSANERARIMTFCSEKGTDFHFIPPRSPHFGGLWEAAVKSAKHLLQKTLAAASLTYEELETVVVGIEAILNSRPLTPLSSNPNDLAALTPGHFLIGESLISSIDLSAEPHKTSLNTRWELVKHLKFEFWRRWSLEYLNQLQHRYRWKTKCENVQPDTMVIIKDKDLPPLKWHLGRIVNVIKGPDGLARVADVRIADKTGKTSITRRAIHTLAPLPMDEISTIESSDEPSSKEDSTHPQPSNDAQQPEISKNGPTTDTDTQPRKRRRYSLRSAMVSLLITCLILPLTSATPLQIEPFNTHSGIYFENLGSVNLVTSEWNLVAYYDMHFFWAEFAAFKRYNEAMTRLCEIMKDKSSCEKTNDQLRHLMKELEANNELLKPTTSRHKRGAFNIIGNVANALFGVLDSTYAENMATTIDNIRQNEEHLVQLIKNQTSVIDSTINIIKRNQQAIDEQLKKWNRHIDQITTQVNQIKEEIYYEKLSTLFISLAMQVMLTASNFQRIQGSLLDVLTDTHHGKISPQLITPQQMRQELLKVKNHLSPQLRLPITDDDPLQLYNLMTIEGRATYDYIIFRLKLPLLALEDFELFSVIPVPVLLNNTFFAIQPSYPYLVINLHRDQYYPLAEYELQTCMSTSEGRYICKQSHPIYRKGSSISDCEVKFLNHITQPPTCNIVHVGDGPYWLQLHHLNRWIYALRHKTAINVVCGDKVEQISIDGSGILTLQDECIIKQELVTIRGHSTFATSTRLSYVPAGNLTNITLIDHPVNILSPTYNYKSNNQELETLKQQLQLVYNDLPQKIELKDIHTLSIGYISLILAAGVITYLLWKYKQNICTRSSRIESSTNDEQKMQRRDSSNSFNISFEV